MDVMNQPICRKAMFCVLICIAECMVLQGNAVAQRIGVNLAGGDFGRIPGVFNKDYTYPGAKQFDYCQKKGLRLIRLPFKWERIQPELMGTLDRDEIGRLDRVVELANRRDLKLVLDMHNYARYGGKLIGTDAVPNVAFADVWKRLATHFRDETAVAAYGIMNEPHGTKGLWPAAAQACIDAIRTVDNKHVISVCGDGWSGAHSWRKYNDGLLLEDAADRLIYEAHQYFDHDNSGTYKKSYDDDGAYPTIGVKRLQPFVEWLNEHKLHGFIGEFGVPDSDPRWLVVLDNTLAEMHKRGLSGTYWAAGPWWNNYPLSVEPLDGVDRPQMAVLEAYLDSDSSPKPKPWIAAAEAAAVAAEKTREEDAKLGRRVFDFREHKESYHYANDGSEFSSKAVVDGDRVARKIAFQHKGSPAWVGLGMYFGKLDCQGHKAFSLELRAETPCRLEIKTYTTDGEKFTAKCDVNAGWKTVMIPFADLKTGETCFTASKPIEKIEFQPSTSQSGNSVYLGAFRFCSTP
jgi:endoglucanase